MLARAIFLSVMMVAASVATALVRPAAPSKVASPDLESMLPSAFGEWKEIKLGEAVLPAEIDLGPGEAVAYRAYRDRVGRVVTLVAAYGPPLGDSVRLHRPESCYVAQGFAIESRSVAPLPLGASLAPIIRLETQNTTRAEAVSYWLRDGDAYVDQAIEHGLLELMRGVSAPSDGALVRVSSTGAGKAEFDAHSRFLQEFADALSPEARALLTTDSQ